MNKPPDEKIDELDRKIIHLLAADGRLPHAEIARKLDRSEATIRKRVARLVADDIIRFVGVADGRKLGFNVVTVVRLSVNLNRISAISETVAEWDEVTYVGLATENSNMILEASFRSDDELASFLTERVGKLEGVKDIETYRILRVIKRVFDRLPSVE